MSKKDQSAFVFQEVRESVNDFFKRRDDSTYMFEFDPSLTRQEFAEECDINTIMSRYEASGVISHVNPVQPVYLDTTIYPGLQGAMDAFREASLQFNALPAKVRREFDNDPQKFVDFAVDPENLPRMREWGLAAPEKVPHEPIRVEVVDPSPPVQNASPAGSEPA